MIDTIKENKKNIVYTALGIILIPIAFIAVTSLIQTIFNLGTDFGTFIRTIFENTVC